MVKGVCKKLAPYKEANAMIILLKQQCYDISRFTLRYLFVPCNYIRYRNLWVLHVIMHFGLQPSLETEREGWLDRIFSSIEALCCISVYTIVRKFYFPLHFVSCRALHEQRVMRPQWLLPSNPLSDVPLQLPLTANWSPFRTLLSTAKDCSGRKSLLPTC